MQMSWGKKTLGCYQLQIIDHTEEETVSRSGPATATKTHRGIQSYVTTEVASFSIRSSLQYKSTGALSLSILPRVFHSLFLGPPCIACFTEKEAEGPKNDCECVLPAL